MDSEGAERHHCQVVDLPAGDMGAPLEMPTGSQRSEGPASRMDSPAPASAVSPPGFT